MIIHLFILSSAVQMHEFSYIHFHKQQYLNFYLLLLTINLLACCYFTFTCFSETRYWPAGSYGIPMAASGCPDTDSCSWLVGSRYEDLEDTNHNSSGSEEFHLKTEIAKNIKRWFCIKSNTTIDKKRSPWPPGRAIIKLLNGINMMVYFKPGE